MQRNSRHSRLASMMALSIMASCSISAAGTATAENPAGASAPRAPVQYRVKEKSLVGNDIHEAGAVVSYAGLPADNLEPLCEEGRRRAAEYVESDKARVQQMIANNSGTASQVGDPTQFMAQFTKALAEERAEHQAQMAAMLEMQQAAAYQLAQASANMAALAAALTAPTTAPAAPAAPAEAPAPAPAPEGAGETGTDTSGSAPAKRSKG